MSLYEWLMLLISATGVIIAAVTLFARLVHPNQQKEVQKAKTRE